MNISENRRFSLDSFDNERLALVCGQCDEHLQQIEQRLEIVIHNRGKEFVLSGAKERCVQGEKILARLFDEASHADVTPQVIHLIIQEVLADVQSSAKQDAKQGCLPIRTRKVLVKPRGESQASYVKKIRNCDINIGVGPAGTGKTYLAVALAIEALEQSQIKRLLLVRPAVEAGERLGFLPGDLSQKVDPYLRPLYDALYEMLGFVQVEKLLDKNIIEVAPLAYMRGRTLNYAFVILDESQNTTPEQMKMFLTRIGFGSKAVITGDITQVDLPKHIPSGLSHALRVLHAVPGIGVTQFKAQDVVRHPLVQRIIEAYQKFEDDSAHKKL